MKVEYRVREVSRYVVTRWYQSDDEAVSVGSSGGVETKGEFDNPKIAHEVAYALCKDEHRRLGYPLDDERIQYPTCPAGNPATEVILPEDSEA